MVAQIGKNSLRTMTQDMFNYPFLVSGSVVKADEGKAVTLDTAANNTVKLATDASSIVGPMIIFEDRTASEGTKNATVPIQGGYRFAVLPAASSPQKPAVGDFLIGAGSGYVRKATDVELATGKFSTWRVAEVEPNTSGLSVVAFKE